MNINIRNLDPEVHRHIKIAAAVNGETLEQFCLRAAHERAQATVKMPLPIKKDA